MVSTMVHKVLREKPWWLQWPCRYPPPVCRLLTSIPLGHLRAGLALCLERLAGPLASSRSNAAGHLS